MLVIVVTGKNLVYVVVSHIVVGIFVALTRDRSTAYMKMEPNGGGIIVKMRGSLKWIKVFKVACKC